MTPSKTLFKLSELTGSDQTVTLTIAPQTGYKLSGMQVVRYGPAISTTRVSNTQYTFTMPNESVRVQAVFDTEWKVLEKELNEGGTVELDQDYISSNEGPLVIYQGQTATLDLAGHTISRNLDSATDNGCVIKVNMGGKLTITDSSSGNTGKITGGFNSGNGGGVYVAKGDPSLNWMGGSLTMLGGQITGNKAAKGGGVYVEQGDQEGYSGSMSISGKPVITGNTLTDGTTKSNVGLSSGASITVTGALTGTGKIGVTPSGYEKFAAGGGSYVIADTDLAKFEKDGSATAVAKKDTDGKAYFAEKELTDSMVSAIPAQTWTGSAIEPEVTVKDGDTPLTKDKNYTVAYSNNTDVGTNTATATITGLYNSSAASYYGSVEKIFSIVKADMPDLDGINKRYLYSEDYADSFSVTGVLPSDCGALSCTITEVSDNLKFVTNPTVTSEGLLSFTIEKNSENTTGTIKIAVETQNYKDSVVTVNILQGDSVRTKLKDGTSVSLKSDTLTYGQTLSSLIFDQAVFVAVDDENTTVDGEIAWKAPDTVPVVGTVSADWVFTPINKIYLPCEGSTAIRVNKANSTVEKAPTARNLTYNGSAQDLVTEGIAEGGKMHYALGTAIEAIEQYTTSIPAKTDAGTYFVWYKVKGDNNHLDTDPVPLTVTIAKKDESDGQSSPEAPGVSVGGTGSSGLEGTTPAHPESLDAVEQRILNAQNDSDIAGSTFSLLQLQGEAGSKKSIRLKWKTVSGASAYTVYGNRSGKGRRYEKIATVSGRSFAAKKLRKGTYYKFIVVAQSGDQALAISKTVFATTKGGKYTNDSKVTVKKSSLKLKRGKKEKIQYSLKNSGKAKRHRNVGFESSNTNVAKVSKKGVVKAVGKGSCYVYAYAQNGVCRRMKVVVK